MAEVAWPLCATFIFGSLYCPPHSLADKQKYKYTSLSLLLCSSVMFFMPSWMEKIARMLDFVYNLSMKLLLKYARVLSFG